MRTSDNRTGWLGRLRRGRKPVPLDPGRDDLLVVASCFDDAEGCSTTLDRAAAENPPWLPEAAAVLRHHLRLPASAVAEAVSIAAQDGYHPRPVPDRPESDSAAPTELILQRVQILDVLHCSQERSRMAGLAQRLGGSVSGWDALQPGRGTEVPGD